MCALTALSLSGVQKAAWATRVIVAVVLVALAGVVVACFAGGTAASAHLQPFPGGSVHGVLQAAGLLFFAFAGYARIATLGEEVRDPARTIPRAIAMALAITVVVYAAVAVAALSAVGPDALAHSAAPLRTAVDAGSLHRLVPAVQIGGALAALGSLLALLLGVSRTTLAMARDRHLPHVLATVSRDVPRRAEIAVGAAVLVLVLTTDLRGAIGFSSFGVLGYYAIANASAFTLTAAERRPPRWLPVLGVTGCAVLAFSLPLVAVLSGAGVLALGALAYLLTRRPPAEPRSAGSRSASGTPGPAARSRRSSAAAARSAVVSTSRSSSSSGAHVSCTRHWNSAPTRVRRCEIPTTFRPSTTTSPGPTEPKQTSEPQSVFSKPPRWTSAATPSPASASTHAAPSQWNDTPTSSTHRSSWRGQEHVDPERAAGVEQDGAATAAAADHLDPGRLGGAGVHEIDALPAAEHHDAALHLDDTGDGLGERLGQPRLERRCRPPGRPARYAQRQDCRDRAAGR